MSEIRLWKIWPPIFYTTVWTIGFIIGIFGILPNAEGCLKLVVGAFTTYFIFLVNAFIDFRLYLYNNIKFETRLTVDWIVVGVAVTFFATILLSRYFVITENKILFGIASLLMVISYFGMEWVKHNPKICFKQFSESEFRTNL